jgi:hypothetical protein
VANLPVRPVVLPAVLRGVKNGRLSSSVLTSVPGAHGGAPVRLVAPAARSWAAMVAAATGAGIQLKVATPGRSYRPYSEQETIFRARYYPSLLGTRRWNGQRWRKRPGVAAAAIPGTSNHGLGLAVDIGEELDGDAGTESISTAAVNWLIYNAHRFGFSAEIQSERWHWRYVAGDQIPAAVLAYENSTGQPQIPHDEEDDMPISIAYDEKARKFRVFVTGEGSTLVDSPDHWVKAIKTAKATGYPVTSPYLQDLIDKCRADRA